MATSRARAERKSAKSRTSVGKEIRIGKLYRREHDYTNESVLILQDYAVFFHCEGKPKHSLLILLEQQVFPFEISQTRDHAHVQFLICVVILAL